MSRIANPLSAALIAVTLALAPVALSAVAAEPAGAATAGEITWSVEPAPTPEGKRRTFEYTVDPGTQVVDNVVITNRGETAADFVIYATDAINEFDTGAFGLLKADETPIDAGAWITTADSTLTLQPGTEATVPFNLLVPSDAAPGDHVAGIVAAVVTQGEQDGAAVTLEQRVGARVYLTVSGVPDAGVAVSGMTSGYGPSFNPFAPGDIDLAYTVSNTGNVRLDVNQSVTVTGPFGIPLGEYTPDPLQELLPRQSVRVEARIPSIVAAFLAWSTVSLTPGAIGTAGIVPDAAPDGTSTPVPTDAAGKDAASTDAATTDTAATDTAAVVDDAGAIEYVPASASVTTLAVSWTLLVLVLLAVAIIYFVVRYMSGTRERLYLAIDAAAAAARAEALASREKTDS